ncbi:hypothetical protein MKX08_007244 [Trichoderma sp. CBMAI-0020]|nr:hypothetical protein MKX08_007244 [Trichoderma sp. CBMAI-0020]WOD45518.1 hypothetical protein [Trichoderma atroviride]
MEISGLSVALSEKGTIVVYAPPAIESAGQVADATEEFVWGTASIVKILANIGQSDSLMERFAGWHESVWGGLIDSESPRDFPMLAIIYIDDYDILQINDGLPRRAILRLLSESHKYALEVCNTLMPKPEGTYIVTGGLGDFGLETCNFLIEIGARNVMIVSRRGLPPRNYQSILAADNAKLDSVISRVRAFEAQGATVHALTLDISLPDAADLLLKAIRALNIPPVLGVVHAAGVLEASSLVETTRDSVARVLAPKVNGALALHNAFPPGSLDFFMMYSSIGQLVGTVGQAAYGSSNAFLDALATYRRARGDNTVAFQFTAVRGLGMATSTSLLMTELRSKGITDITAGEAFRTWEHLGRYDVESAVVTRCLPLLEGDPAAISLLGDIVVRRPRIKLKGLETAANSTATVTTNNDTIKDETVPAHPLEREKWVDKRVCECVARVLMMDDVGDISSQTRLSDQSAPYFNVEPPYTKTPCPLVFITTEQIIKDQNCLI